MIDLFVFVVVGFFLVVVVLICYVYWCSFEIVIKINNVENYYGYKYIGFNVSNYVVVFVINEEYYIDYILLIKIYFEFKKIYIYVLCVKLVM